MDPDELLKQIRKDEQSASRGRLKIFFGAVAGVGKTYTMLEAAHAAKKSGSEVVAGYVEPHEREETARLLEGLEALPFLSVRQRGLTRREFDLNAALKRHPQILLVDELAHSNMTEGEPRPRHAKRWQDIEELLASGINVWTTLNVQHLESLNDVVAGITGIRQQETIPDRIFDQADDVELIDLPPIDLLARLKSGKVYAASLAANALEGFFREPNLLALRELALRRTADRVDAAARAFGPALRQSRPWLARDRFLIAVKPDDQAEQLVRVGKRFADALDAEWLVVSVETPDMLNLGEGARNRRIDVLRLAESLGAQTVTLDGPSASETLLEYAKLRNVTRIVAGEPNRLGFKHWFTRSTAAKLVEAGSGVDVSVITRRGPKPTLKERAETVQPLAWRPYWIALGITAACTVLATAMFPFLALTNIAMVYLLGATITALRYGRGPASLAAIANVIAYDFFFVPPRYSFAVSDFQYVLTFAVMLGVALTIATLATRVRAQSRVAGARERRTALLYAMSRELAATRALPEMSVVAVRHVAETFSSRAVVLVPDAEGKLVYPGVEPVGASLIGADLSIAQWVFDHAVPAGLGTDTLPAAEAQYLPLKATRGTLGVLAVEPTQKRKLLLPEQRHLLETFAGQIAVALERAELASQAETARVRAETESLRNTLLASISHDLRTPLAAIAGAGSALSDPAMNFDSEARRKLAHSIEDKAREMTDIISNVLELMRLQAGQVALRRDWHSLEDLIQAARQRLDERLKGHTLKLELPEGLAPVNVDAPVVVQVFANILENVARHTPKGTSLTVRATPLTEGLLVELTDDGPGFPGTGDPAVLFAKFQRGREEGNTGGAGLGLAIAKAIIEAHGGRIGATRLPIGARIFFTLPTA